MAFTGTKGNKKSAPVKLTTRKNGKRKILARENIRKEKKRENWSGEMWEKTRRERG